MHIVRFDSGDVIIMKKKHPCSSEKFKIIRCGSDVKIRCIGCSRELTIDRDKLEKMIKSVEVAEQN